MDRFEQLLMGHSNTGNTVVVDMIYNKTKISFDKQGSILSVSARFNGNIVNSMNISSFHCIREIFPQLVLGCTDIESAEDISNCCDSFIELCKKAEALGTCYVAVPLDMDVINISDFIVGINLYNKNIVGLFTGSDVRNEFICDMRTLNKDVISFVNKRLNILVPKDSAVTIDALTAVLVAYVENSMAEITTLDGSFKYSNKYLNAVNKDMYDFNVNVICGRVFIKMMITTGGLCMEFDLPVETEYREIDEDIIHLVRGTKTVEDLKDKLTKIFYESMNN